MVSLGGIAILGSIFFRIDEVITVRGQLQSLEGTTDVKTPAGGKILEVYFKEGQLVSKGDLLVQFDTTAALNQKKTLTRLIQIEQGALDRKLRLLNDKQAALSKKVDTYRQIVDSLRLLVSEGGFQRVE